MKSLLLILVAVPLFANAQSQCPKTYASRVDNKTIIEKETQKYEQNGVSIENCTDLVNDIINADTESRGGAPGISRTTITACDGDNTQHHKKFKVFFKIVRFQAIGSAKSDGFYIRTNTCPLDNGDSVTVTVSTIPK